MLPPDVLFLIEFNLKDGLCSKEEETVSAERREENLIRELIRFMNLI